MFWAEFITCRSYGGTAAWWWTFFCSILAPQQEVAGCDFQLQQASLRWANLLFLCLCGFPHHPIGLSRSTVATRQIAAARLDPPSGHEISLYNQNCVMTKKKEWQSILSWPRVLPAQTEGKHWNVINKNYESKLFSPSTLVERSYVVHAATALSASF